MFKRTKVLIEGDYLWSPSCTFVIKTSPSLDLEALKVAVDEYDIHYLQKLSEGKDPDKDDIGFNITNDQIAWKKNDKDITKIVDKEYNTEARSNTSKANTNKSTKRLSALKMKHSTFHEDLHSNDVKSTSMHLTDTDSIKTDNSKWTAKSKLSEEKSNIKKKKIVTSENPMNTNAFSEDDKKISDPQKKNQSSSEDFERISSQEQSKDGSNSKENKLEKDNEKKKIEAESKNVVIIESEDEHDSISDFDEEEFLRRHSTRRITEYNK
jgi:hypothetical protein